eukprot:TRINITY_DN2463_c0_g2_i1.p1 TRINITY_DN2463_c0_g2~~TRINITY_DN2463_c0_g2_i1.p1  ORF type:complete len:503 (-),score=102.42 TRINITY_DN2463_c0_g2_i1:166-1674(-)
MPSRLCFADDPPAPKFQHPQLSTPSRAGGCFGDASSEYAHTDQKGRHQDLDRAGSCFGGGSSANIVLSDPHPKPSKLQELPTVDLEGAVPRVMPKPSQEDCPALEETQTRAPTPPFGRLTDMLADTNGILTDMMGGHERRNETLTESGGSSSRMSYGLDDAYVSMMDEMEELQRQMDNEQEKRRRWVQIASEALLLLLFMFSGTLFYMYYEGWDFVDGLYFVLVTTTAVGYGDLHPSDHFSRTFTVCYVFLGAMILAASLGTWSATAAEKMTQALEGRKEDSSCWNDLETRRLVSSMVLLVGTVFAGTQFYTWYGLQDGEDLSYWDGLYLCAMTVTTVGYGDIAPTSRGARLFTIFYIAIGVAIFANCIQVVVTVYIKREIQRRQKKLLQRRLTHKELLRYGGDNGKLDRCEFAIVKLIQQGKVTHREIGECLRQFHAMDVDGSGFLDSDDLAQYPDLENHRSSTEYNAEIEQTLSNLERLAAEARMEGVLDNASPRGLSPI